MDTCVDRRRAVVATLLGLSVLALRLALEGVLDGRHLFLFAWPAVLVAAFLGGARPGGVVLAAAVLLNIGLDPGQGLTRAGVTAIGLFAISASLMIAVVAWLHRARARAAAYAAQLEEAQSQLLNIERLNAIGAMAGTLAHELNQPLSAISSYAAAARALLQRPDPPAEKVSEILQKVVTQASRAAQIVGRVRGAVTLGETALRPERVSEMVSEAMAVVAAAEITDVTLRCEADRSVDWALADRIQVQQVLLNLMRNAVQSAASRGASGEVVVRWRPADESHVEIAITDTGPGISPEIAHQLFHPFATTKQGGMGLGLAISRKIIEAHGGRISGENRPQGGAIFRFTLPKADPP